METEIIDDEENEFIEETKDLADELLSKPKLARTPHEPFRQAKLTQSNSNNSLHLNKP
jgi:hypothetical protein